MEKMFLLTAFKQLAYNLSSVILNNYINDFSILPFISDEDSNKNPPLFFLYPKSKCVHLGLPPFF